MDKVPGSEEPKKEAGLDIDWTTVVPRKAEAKPVKPAEPGATDKITSAATSRPLPGRLGLGSVDTGTAAPLATRVAPGLDSKLAGPRSTQPLIDKTQAQTSTAASVPGWRSKDFSKLPKPAEWKLAQPADAKPGQAAAPADSKLGGAGAPADSKLGGAGAPTERKLGGAGAPTERIAETDSQTKADRPGLLELSYTDPEFDKKLWSGSHDTLRITDVPPNVKISSWIDEKGFFLFYKNGTDRKPHYLPPTVRTLLAKDNTPNPSTGMPNPEEGVRNVDELRMQARVFARSDKNPPAINFEKVYGREDPLHFAQRMGGLGTQALTDMEVFLRKETASSPNDPQAHFLLSDVLLGQAFKPIIEQVTSGSDVIRMNTPYTEQRLDEAIKERQKAMDIMKRQGLTLSTPPLVVGPLDRQMDIEAALALYPNWWGELGLKAIKFYIEKMPEIELPPILKPR